MTPLEQRLLDTLKEVGSYPSRFQLCIDAGVNYGTGYYAIELLAARGLVSLEHPATPRQGKAVTIRIIPQGKHEHH